MEFHKFESESDDSGNEKKIKNKSRGQSWTNKSIKTPPRKKEAKQQKAKSTLNRRWFVDSWPLLQLKKKKENKQK